MSNTEIRSAGDVRRFLVDVMQGVKSGEISGEKANAIAALSKELHTSMQVEINAAKLNLQIRKEGAGTFKLRNLGGLLIDGAPEVAEPVED